MQTFPPITEGDARPFPITKVSFVVNINKSLNKIAITKLVIGKYKTGYCL